jgi:hypothetical protein
MFFRRKAKTVFFTTAVGPHQMFAIPYCFSVLASNADAFVEVMVDNATAFIEDNAAALALLPRGRFLIRNAQFGVEDAPYMRFLTTPITRAPHVYIGDVDIFVLDGDITAQHLRQMKDTKLPYSNKLRPSKTRLSGLHFTKWDAYYPVEHLPLSVLKGAHSDEIVLRLLVESRHPLPTHNFRPVHGIHMSLSRKDVIRDAGRNSIAWMTAREAKSRWSQYQRATSQSSSWQTLKPLLDPGYLTLLKRLEDACVNLR